MLQKWLIHKCGEEETGYHHCPEGVLIRRGQGRVCAAGRSGHGRTWKALDQLQPCAHALRRDPDAAKDVSQTGWLGDAGPLLTDGGRNH